MPSFRLSIVFFTLVGISISLRCFEGQTKKNVIPLGDANCTGSYCLKIKVYSDKNYWYNNYTCGDGVCTKDGCQLDRYGVIRCCCSQDMCNTASAFFSLFSVVPMIILKVFM